MMSNANGSLSIVPEPSPSPTGQLPGQRLVCSDKDNDDCTTAKDQFSGNWNKTLWFAAQEGKRDQAARALESRADPNQSQKWETGPRAEWYEGCISTMAVMRNDIEMLKLLVQYKAELVAPYYVPDKSNEVESPLAFAARSVEMLKELSVLKADLEKTKSVHGNAVTLLWNASHDGHQNIVKFLLDRGSENLENPCVPQVNSCVTPGRVACTPLHIASRMGHLEVVRVLIERRARVQVRCGGEYASIQTPLMAAIDQHHGAVVRLLVQKQAKVFSDEVVNLLFRSNFVGTIEAVTDGLLCAKEEDAKDFRKNYLQGVERHWEKFFKTSSHAMLSMIHLIFQETSLGLQVTDTDGSESMCPINHACIPDYRKINSAEGPDVRHCNSLILERENLNWVDRTFGSETWKIVPDADDIDSKDLRDRISKFLERLLYKPAQSDITHELLHPLFLGVHAHTQKQVPIHMYQCVVPGMHRDPDLFFMIAKQKDDAVFEDPAVQAMLQFTHQCMKWKFFRRLIGNFCLLGCFVKMSVKVNHHVEAVDKGEDVSQGELQHFVSNGLDAALIAFLGSIILYNIAREIFQIAGFVLLGKSGTYWSDFWNLFELGSLVMITAVGCGLTTSYESFVNPEKEAYIKWRALLSVVVFLNWLRVFSVLRVHRLAGPTILPILHGFENILPFLAVTSCPLIGLFHAYYCFGIYKEDVWRTFSIVYRLGIVGDFDLEEMEDVDGHYVPEENDGAVQHIYVQPDKGSWWLVLRIFLLVCSTILTVAMMNIFIGVLSESYNDARKRAEAIFWKTRAEVLVEEVAMETAWERLSSCKCGNQRLLQKEDGVFMESQECSQNDGLGTYLWFCRRVEGRTAQSNSCKEAATQEDLFRLEEHLHRLEEHLESTHSTILEELKRVRATSESSKLQEQHTHQVDLDAESLKGSGAALTSDVRKAPRKEVPQAQPVASRARHIESQLMDKLQDVVLGLEKENACLRQDMVQLEADVDNVKGRGSLLVEIAKDKHVATQLLS